MKTFRASLHLDEASLKALKSVLGLRLYRVLAPCLQVAEQEFASPSLSLERGAKGYLAIACAWLESPYTWTDYWRFLISEQAQPVGIEIAPDGAIISPCTIHLYQSHTISSIEIRSSHWDWSDTEEEEHVEFDSLLLFNTHEGRQFCIWCQLNGPGSATEVHFTQDRALISGLLTGTHMRLYLE